MNSPDRAASENAKQAFSGDFANMPETADITLVDEENKYVITWHPIIR